MNITTDETLERLFCEYEASCRKLTERIAAVDTVRRQFASDSFQYRILYERARRLRRYLADTREWQEMIYRCLRKGGMTDAEIRLLLERAA